MLIIQTNLSLAESDRMDHQSYVLEVSDWDEYVNFFQDKAKQDIQNCTMPGKNPVKTEGIVDLQFDDFHLKCFYLDGSVTLGYKIDNRNNLKFI